MKTLLIGWDAADWKVIHPLLDAGKLPALQSIVDNGTIGNLQSLQPMLSPTLWTSIATGKRPYKHGIYGFIEPDPVGGGVRPVTNFSRKTKALWNIFNQNGKETVTVGWWPSHPAEPLSKGIMVSNEYQKYSSQGGDREKWEMSEGTVHPENLSSSLKDLRMSPHEIVQQDLRLFMPELKNLSEDEREKVLADPRVLTLAKVIAHCGSIQAAATSLLLEKDWELGAVYFDGIDHFGHAFMKFHPPQQKSVEESDFKLFHYVIEAAYRFHDMMLGTLLAIAGDEANVILISDHGFHPDHLRLSQTPNEPAGPAAEHRALGIFAAKGPSIRKDANVYGASLLDITPTILSLHDLPVGRDMDGKILDKIFANLPDKPVPIASWDEVEGDHGMHPPDRQISAKDSQASLDQLVALGYIDAPGKNGINPVETAIRELDYNLARAWIDGGFYHQGADILTALYEKWPGEHRFGYQLATCQASLGNHLLVKGLIETIIERRVEEAEIARKKLKDLNLDDDETLRKEDEYFASLTDQQKRAFSAERAELVRLATPSLHALNMLSASTDAILGNYEKALEKLQIPTNNPRLRFQNLVRTGHILLKARRSSEALEAFNKAKEIDPEDATVQLGLGRALLIERKDLEAVECIKASLGFAYHQPSVHFLLSTVYLRIGNLIEAEEAIMNGLNLNPMAPVGYRLLSKLSTLQGDLNNAKKYRGYATEARAIVFQKRSEKRTESLQSTGAISAPDNIEFTIQESQSSDSDVITVVSGLPRSGTSLMMQMLAAAGIPAFTDEKRTADSSNKKGYFEHNSVLALTSNQSRSWILEARRKAIKVIAPLVPKLPLHSSAEASKFEQEIQYRFIFMERNLDELIESQRRMLEKLGRPSSTADPRKGYLQQIQAAKKMINRSKFPGIRVSHADLFESPEPVIEELARFLHLSTEDAERMRTVIDPSLRSVDLQKS